MLRKLSNRTHEVVSGLYVVSVEGRRVKLEKGLTVSTQVSFRRLDDREIGAYVATGEPMDKAGAYAIQGRASSMVTAIRGSCTNVIGLPLSELVDMLERYFGYPLV